MRRTLPSSIRLLAAPRPLVCRSPLRCSNFSTTPHADARLDGLRRKLWGSDKPPGPEDPYAKPVETPDAQVESSAVGNTEYMEAFDARGLPIVGLEETLGVWEVDSFAPTRKRRLEEEAVHRAVHRATVEAFTVHLNGRKGFGLNTPAGKEGEGLTERVNIEVAENGEVRFLYGAPEIEEAIIWSLEELEKDSESKSQQSDSESSDSENKGEGTIEIPEPRERAPEVNAASIAPVPEPVPQPSAEPKSQPEWLVAGLEGRGWIKTPLPNTDITFLITKRILQLTGLQVPDIVSTQAKTIGDLIAPLVQPEKKTKLWDELKESTDLQELKNLKVFGAKVKRLEKEKMIGRAVLRPEDKDYIYRGIDDQRKEPVWRGHVTYR